MARSLPSWIRVGAVTIKPLRPTPNIVTAGDLHDYTDLLDPLIQSLDRDVKQNVATGDPDELVAQATVLEYEAKKIDAALPAYASELRDRAAAKRELAAKGAAATSKPFAPLADQKAFNERWAAFLPRWNKEAAEVRAILVLTSGGDWTKLQAYDVEYQDLYNQYRALGFTPTMKPPPPPPDTPSLSIPTWLPILAGGVIVIIGLSYISPIIRTMFTKAA